MDLLAEFPLYVPHSAGSDAARNAIAHQAISRTIPELALLAREMTYWLSPVDISTFPVTPSDHDNARELGALFEKYGSDKAWHRYQEFYGPILWRRDAPQKILEIGLGTNNIDVVSHMGPEGKPGASARAFRDFLPNSTICGADIDRRVLFTEERIRTFYVDQTNEASLRSLFSVLPDGMDLIIDDGLHAPYANLPVLRHALKKVRPGGWVVIEDVQENSIPVWQTVVAFLPHGYQPHLLQARGGMLFAVKSTPPA